MDRIVSYSMCCIACKHGIILIIAMRLQLTLNGLLFVDELSNNHH